MVKAWGWENTTAQASKHMTLILDPEAGRASSLEASERREG